MQRHARALIPYAQGGLISMLHESATVLNEEYTDTGITAEFMADEETISRLAAKIGEQALTLLD